MAKTSPSKPLGPDELEQKLQEWSSGVQSGIWIPIRTVEALCQGVTADDFGSYLSKWNGRDAILRGFFLHEVRRKPHSIYIFDRSQAQDNAKKRGADFSIPEAPDIRLWLAFTARFNELYEKDREAFFEEAFAQREHRRVVFTWAAALFGIQKSRLALMTTLDALLSEGLLPRPNPKAAVAATGSSEQQQSSPTIISPPEKRSRRSLGSPELGGLEASPSEELSREGAGAIHFVDSLFELTEQEVKRGNIAPLAFEEFVLECALLDTELVDLFKAKREAPKAFANILAERWRTAVVPCGTCMPPLFKVDGPGGCLNVDDGLNYFGRFMFAIVGHRARRDRERRTEKLVSLRAEWASTQLFQPRPSESLIDHVANAKRYNWGCAVVHPRSMLATNIGAPQQRRESGTFDEHKRVMTAKNEFFRTVLSHRTIFLLLLAKEAGEISDVKWLLVSSLFIYAISGELLDVTKMKQLCISGPALVTRSRQLFWRIKKNIAEKINGAPGVHSVATDDTEIKNSNAGARAVSYVDIENGRPAYEFISRAPTGRKTAEAGAEALAIAYKQRQLHFSNMQGGSSDNAPNASNMISDFFDLAQKEVNGDALDPDGNAVVSLFNGVPARVVWFGSGLHIWHLLNGHFRSNSFGVKIGMDSPTPGQLPFKWNAILRSDQQVSGRGMSSFRVMLNAFFGGSGFWSLVMTEEHEGRWGQSLQSRVEILKYLDYPMGALRPEHAALGPNALSAAAMYMRMRLKPKSWQIAALLQVAIWSCSPEIVWAIRVEVETSKFYLKELAWYRSSPDRSYMSSYAPEFKARLLPGRIVLQHLPYFKKMAADPMSLLPESLALLGSMFEDEVQRDEMISRVRQGGLAQLQYFKKHQGWAFKALGIVLSINTPGIAGAVARAMIQILGSEMFPLEGEIKAGAMLAVADHRENPDDVFWLKLALADAADVRHFALQFGLVGGDPTELLPLSKEWLALCKLTDSEADKEVIENEFDRLFPVLHRRQLLYVDPNFTDTSMLEGSFSVQRRKYNDSMTNARFEDVMLFDAHVLTDLRNVGRSAGESQRAGSKARRDALIIGPAKKATEQSASDWCYTYTQVHAILKRVDSHFLPMFDEGNMVGAPRVRMFKEDSSYTAQDVKLAESWVSKLEHDSEDYHREVSSEELLERGLAIKLTYQLDDSPVQMPMLHRLEVRFSSVDVDSLMNELKCHLPLALSAMKAATSGVWPEVADSADKKRLAFRTLLATLLPPLVQRSPLIPCFRQNGAILKGGALGALKIFSRNARLLLDFLGFHEDDLRDILRPDVEPSRYIKGAGSAGAFFIAGPFALRASERLRHGQVLGPGEPPRTFTSVFFSETEAERAMGL